MHTDCTQHRPGQREKEDSSDEDRVVQLRIGNIKDIEAGGYNFDFLGPSKTLGSHMHDQTTLRSKLQSWDPTRVTLCFPQVSLVFLHASTFFSIHRFFTACWLMQGTPCMKPLSTAHCLSSVDQPHCHVQLPWTTAAKTFKWMDCPASEITYKTKLLYMYFKYEIYRLKLMSYKWNMRNS